MAVTFREVGVIEDYASREAAESVADAVAQAEGRTVVVEE